MAVELTERVEVLERRVGVLEQGEHILSARQRAVLRLAGMGLADKQIARELGVATATVSNHMSRAIGAMGARNRAHAVARAFARGMLEL